MTQFLAKIAIFAFSIQLTAIASTTPKTELAAAVADAPRPFNLTFAITSPKEAEQRFEELGAKVTDGGYRVASSLRNGTSLDGIANPNIYILEVTGLPLDKLESAKFGFFQEKMYFVIYKYQRYTNPQSIYESIKEKYGQPKTNVTLSSWVWSINDILIDFQTPIMDNPTLKIVHRPLSALAEKSTAEIKKNASRNYDASKSPF